MYHGITTTVSPAHPSRTYKLFYLFYFVLLRCYIDHFSFIFLITWRNKILEECHNVSCPKSLKNPLLKFVVALFLARTAQDHIRWENWTRPHVSIDVAGWLIIVPWYFWNTERAKSLSHLNTAELFGFYTLHQLKFRQIFQNVFTDYFYHSFLGVQCVCRSE